MYVAVGLCKLSETPNRKEASDAARRLLTAMLREEGIPCPAPLVTRQDENGRPFLGELRQRVDFNLSHAGCYVACALAVAETENAPPRVGIDVEIHHPRIHRDRLAARFFSERERNAVEAAEDRDAAFLRIWTRKEAYLKFTGKGISGGLKETDTTDPNALCPPAEIRSYALCESPDATLALALPKGVTPPEAIRFFPQI